MSLIEKVQAQAWDFSFINPIQSDENYDLSTIITSIISLILLVAGGLAIIYLIYSGILYITAAGNPDSAKKGQQGVINAIIGIVIIVLAYVIARTVASYAGGLNTT